MIDEFQNVNGKVYSISHKKGQTLSNTIEHVHYNPHFDFLSGVQMLSYYKFTCQILQQIY